MSGFEPVAQDLRRLEQRFQETWSADPELAAGPMRELMEAGGKRLRPTLLLLCAQLGDYDYARIEPAAMAVELTHAATLVHDDIIDRSAWRRGRPTVFAQAGASEAILVGDYYFGRAYREASRTGQATVVEVLATTVMAICEGELEQQKSRFDYLPRLDRYLRRCELKTGRLLAAACLIGAQLGDLDARARKAVERYGLQLGIAFQVVDDVLDYRADAAVLGKPSGHDLMEGSATLPLMLARPHPGLDRLLVQGQPPTPDAVAEVVALVRATGGCDRAMEVARRHAELALTELPTLPDTAPRAALRALVGEVLERGS